MKTHNKWEKKQHYYIGPQFWNIFCLTLVNYKVTGTFVNVCFFPQTDSHVSCNNRNWLFIASMGEIVIFIHFFSRKLMGSSAKLGQCASSCLDKRRKHICFHEKVCNPWFLTSTCMLYGCLNCQIMLFFFFQIMLLPYFSMNSYETPAFGSFKMQ